MRKQFWFTTILMVIMFISSACGPSKAEVNAAIIKTSDAKKTERAAEPTRTPMPTLPPHKIPTKPTDNRSPFDKCAQSGFGVRYAISGNNVSGISITLENDTGGTDQGDYKLPYCRSFQGFKSGDFLYISAQIINGEGSITCKIYDGTTVISQANASGFASIATCSGTAK